MTFQLLKLPVLYIYKMLGTRGDMDKQISNYFAKGIFLLYFAEHISTIFPLN